MKRVELSKEREIQTISRTRKDPRAFAPLYEQCYDRIFLYLLRRCGNRSLAEDLTSETFIKALRNIRSFRHDGSPFKAWLFRIAHNEFISHCRKEKVRRLFRVDRRQNGHRHSSGSKDAYRNLEQGEIVDRLEESIQQLSPRDQLLVTLRYYEDFSMRDIAAVSGLSEGNVRTRLHRALARLKSMIEKDVPEIATLVDGAES